MRARASRARVASDFVQRVDQLLAALPVVEEAVVGEAPEATEVLRDWLQAEARRSTLPPAR